MANQHVVPNNGQWQVKRENSTRATKNFNTRDRFKFCVNVKN